MENFDWTTFNAKLPVGRSDEEKTQRKAMFRQFDPNGNGILSLAEVDKSIMEVIQMDDVTNMKPAIMRAFQIAKDVTKSKRGDIGDDYIEFKEFRYFLVSLRQYIEYNIAFSRIDADSDKRISLVEFKEAQPKIEEWVGKIDAEEEFKKIDTNDGGIVLFDEFCKWAIHKSLDLEDDEELE